MEERSSPEIFRGHFEECLAHLNQKIIALSRRSSQKKRFIASLAKFCGVNIDAVSRWVHGNSAVPIGDNKIKLMCYFDLLGYKVIELENMSFLLRNLAEIIGFNVMAGTDATKIIGYAEPSTLYGIIAGKLTASKEKEETFRSLIKDKKEQLAQVKTKAKNELPETDLNYIFPTRVEVSTAPAEQTQVLGTENQKPYSGTSLLPGLVVLLAEADLETISDEELAAWPTTAVEAIDQLAAKITKVKKRLERHNGDANGQE